MPEALEMKRLPLEPKGERKIITKLAPSFPTPIVAGSTIFSDLDSTLCYLLKTLDSNLLHLFSRWTRFHSSFVLLLEIAAQSHAEWRQEG